jgi:hypothetical protein
MIALLTWGPPERRLKHVTYKEKMVLHMRLWEVRVAHGPRTPEAALRRRVLSAARHLHKAGITRVILPENFSYVEQLAKYGVRPVSTLSLRRELAADWVRWSLTERDAPVAGARVAVSAAQLTGEVVRTVTELSLRHRYVLLDLPYGGEALCRQLRREYGVSLLLGPSKDQLEGAESLVLFDSRTDLDTPNALRLYDETEPLPPISLPPTLAEQLPAGADRGQLLAALREAGAIKTGVLSVGR